MWIWVEQRAKSPVLLYDRFDFFPEILDWENNFHRWGAIMILSNLVSVDSEKKFDPIFEKYFAPIKGPNDHCGEYHRFGSQDRLGKTGARRPDRRRNL